MFMLCIKSKYVIILLFSLFTVSLHAQYEIEGDTVGLKHDSLMAIPYNGSISFGKTVNVPNLGNLEEHGISSVTPGGNVDFRLYRPFISHYTILILLRCSMEIIVRQAEFFLIYIAMALRIHCLV